MTITHKTYPLCTAAEGIFYSLKAFGISIRIMDIKQRQCQGPVGKEQDMKKTALYVAAAALCAAALAGCTAGGAAQGTVAAPQAQAEATRSISVEAYETISLTPDMAAIGVGVVNEAATVEEVTSQNSEAVEKIIGCFRELGYEDASMDTSDIGLYPQYDYSGGESVLTGYRMDTTISLTDVPTEQVSDVLIAALEHEILVDDRLLAEHLLVIAHRTELPCDLCLEISIGYRLPELRLEIGLHLAVHLIDLPVGDGDAITLSALKENLIVDKRIKHLCLRDTGTHRGIPEILRIELRLRDRMIAYEIHRRSGARDDRICRKRGNSAYQHKQYCYQ